MRPDPDLTAEWYRRAARELAPHSALHARWSAAIAADVELLDRIDRLPRSHRQPSLVLCAAAFAGAPTASAWPDLRDWLLASWTAVEDVSATRTTQTNEPGRRLPLALSLARISGPIALLEVGASAGLCLLPDRSVLRFVRGDESTEFGSGTPSLEAVVTGPGPLPERMPEIVWRRGLDLAPLSVLDADDVRWLEALVPPDRPDRRRRLGDAVTAARLDPPVVIQGDALADLGDAVVDAPGDATLVVASLGTAVYLPPDARARLLPAIAALGARAVTLEAERALPQVADAVVGRTAPEPHPFVLALDGVPLARCAPHGERVSLLVRARRRPSLTTMSSPLPHHPPASPLDADEARVLDFERDWTGTTGAKEAAIRSQLGLSATRYYRLLHRAIDDPSALAKDPMLVRRLQRLRAARSAARASRTFRAD